MSHFIRKPTSICYATCEQQRSRSACASASAPLDQRRLISAFVVRCLDSIIPIFAISKISRLLIVAVTEQAGLSFTLSGDVAQISRGNMQRQRCPLFSHRPPTKVHSRIFRGPKENGERLLGSTQVSLVASNLHSLCLPWVRRMPRCPSESRNRLDITMHNRIIILIFDDAIGIR